MYTREELANKNILIIGYALTGKSVAEFLLNCGAKVTINDRGDLSQDPSVRLLKKKNARIVDGGHPLTLLDESFDFIVKNPGIPYNIPIIQAAIEKQIPIYTDIEIASWVSPAPIIAVTGSNGKTTTTSLIHAILDKSPDSRNFLSGNIGIPTLDVVQQVSSDDKIVMEVSSFQLEGTQWFHPHVAVICNIYEAHLDYHGSLTNYQQAKYKIIANMTAEDAIVYNYDQPELDATIQKSTSEKIPFATKRIDDYVRNQGVYCEEGWIYYRGQRILPQAVIALPGEHNLQNVLAAVAVAMYYDVPNEVIQQAVAEFAGIKHRIQFIREFAGRKFYNDSKSTNITALNTALSSFTQPIIYIGGGLDRGNDFDAVGPYLTHVRAAYLYGETNEKMAETFKHFNVPVVETFDQLSEATEAAYRQATPGEVVLFSPGCASWDQFENYEVRGQTFIDLIDTLIEKTPYDEVTE